MEDPYKPVYGTLILMSLPIVVAYVVDYLYTLWDRIFPKEIKYRD